MSPKHKFSLEGKVVLQCGGSGQLGRALTRELFDAGAKVVVASRDPLSLQKAADEDDFEAEAIQWEQVDIACKKSVHALRDRIVAAHGRIDGLVHNVVKRPMRKMESGVESWTESMALNATGMYLVMRTFGDVMARAGAGSIVNIASIQGIVGHDPWLYEDTSMAAPPDYFFHKGGMINFTRYLASHYGQKGVRVNAISPGGIFDPSHPQNPIFVERYNKSTMLNRMAAADEVGGTVVFLLSAASSYITGTNIPIDGGYTAK